MPEATNRQRLTETQARLAAALTKPSEAPPHAFDPERLRLAASMLRHKRRKTLAHLLPRLHASLSAASETLYVAYIEVAPSPPPNGTLADAIAFARFVHSRRLLSPDAARELLLLILTTQRLACLRLQTPPCLLIGIRLFRRRVRFLHLPLPPKRESTAAPITHSPPLTVPPRRPMSPPTP